MIWIALFFFWLMFILALVALCCARWFVLFITILCAALALRIIWRELTQTSVY